MYDAFGNYIGPDAPAGGYLSGDQLSGSSAPSSGPNWSNILLTGVSAAIDSQIAHPYSLNNPVYNTQYGIGGQGQLPYAGARASVGGNPIVLVGLGLLLYFLMKK